MTVGELFEKLNEVPKDSKVYINRGPCDVNEIYAWVYDEDSGYVDLFD